MKFFDLHCDTLTKCMNSGENLYKNNMQNSLEALLEYDMPCQLFAIFTDDEYVENAYSYAKKAVEFYRDQKKIYGDHLTDLSETPSDGKVNALLTIEGGEPVESIEALEEFHSLGIRLMTLTWNRINKIGSGMMSGDEKGLTDFGKDIVRKMNGLNMVIDVSHLNIQGFKDVVGLSDKPIAATHSNCRSICSHKRNLEDWQIKEIKATGGIIGLNLYPPFVLDNGEADTEALLRHIDRFLELGCEENLCLGCDFDGISFTPTDIGGTKDMAKFYASIQNIFGKKTADAIFFDNAFGFWKRTMAYG